ncbi:MAG: 2-phospho-L-lactate guanylyltransferase [Anaerolineae bacterium]
MNIWAIVPVKPLKRSKSRLSSVLTTQQRETLSRQMLEQTLLTLKQVKGIEGVLIISRDAGALALGRKLEAQTLTESGSPELNASLTRATRVVASWNGSGVLIVASDIPLLQAADIEGMLALAKGPAPVVVIASDRRREGTNALLVRPPGLFPYRFGEGSFKKHIDEAEKAGAVVKVFQSGTLGLDVDLPADLDLYRELLAERSAGEAAWYTGI